MNSKQYEKLDGREVVLSQYVVHGLSRRDKMTLYVMSEILHSRALNDLHQNLHHMASASKTRSER